MNLSNDMSVVWSDKKIQVSASTYFWWAMSAWDIVLYLNLFLKPQTINEQYYDRFTTVFVSLQHNDSLTEIE